MKSNITSLTLAAVVAILLAACSAATPEDNKQARLEKLKQDQASLAKEIAKLESEIAKENPDAAKNARAKEIAVAEIKTQKFDQYVKTQGKVESENDVIITAKTPGIVTQVYASVGDQVSKGQLLAQLDNAIIQSQVEAMQSQLTLATTVFQRQENLWKQKIGTEVQYLQAKTQKESLEKQLVSLREQNELYRITAPIAGTVDDMQLKVGQGVQPGIPAARVVNASELKLKANVSESFVTKVNKNDKAVVIFSESNKEIVAKVTFVGKTIDPLSRTFPVEVSLPASPEFRPNMSATVKLVYKTDNAALVVPVNVIQEVNKEKIIYVAATEGGKTVARKKVVTVEGVFDGNAQIQGLVAGDRIITVGYQGLNDGDLVKI